MRAAAGRAFAAPGPFAQIGSRNVIIALDAGEMPGCGALLAETGRVRQGPEGRACSSARTHEGIHERRRQEGRPAAPRTGMPKTCSADLFQNLSSMVHRMAQILRLFRALLMDDKHRRNLSSMEAFLSSMGPIAIHGAFLSSIAWGLEAATPAPSMDALSTCAQGHPWKHGRTGTPAVDRRSAPGDCKIGCVRLPSTRAADNMPTYPGVRHQSF